MQVQTNLTRVAGSEEPGCPTQYDRMVTEEMIQDEFCYLISPLDSQIFSQEPSDRVVANAAHAQD